MRESGLGNAWVSWHDATLPHERRHANKDSRPLCLFNGDNLPDIVVGGMKGCHVLLHSAEPVDEERWRAAQPQPLAPAK